MCQFTFVENIEEVFDSSGQPTTKGFYTIGVVVEASKALNSKNNTPFCHIKITDLVKYVRKKKYIKQNHIGYFSFDKIFG